MKIEKGKLYLDTGSNTLFKADFDSDNYGDFASDKIAVYCPSKEDFDYVNSVFKNCNHIRPHVYINEELGERYGHINYHAITIDQFREFYPEEDKELTTGKWYKTEDNSCLFYHRGGNSSYGLQKGVWTENWDTDLHTWERDGLTVLEAAVEEVESALIEEAKRLGHKYEKYAYNSEENTLCGYNGRLEEVFVDGKWNEPYDKFSDLKEAHKNGAVIEWFNKIESRWEVPTNIIWDTTGEYRIKPEEEKLALDYGSRIDPIDFIVSNKFDFLEGCVIALVSQHKEKDGIEDLKAAQHYLQRLIDRYES